MTPRQTGSITSHQDRENRCHSPQTIADKEFSFGLRGYDQTEVREFLSLVASEVAGGIVIAANLGDGTQTPGTGVQGDQGAEVVGGDAAAAQAAAMLDRAHRERQRSDGRPKPRPRS